jgi:molybdopterin-guanine dinucleotide biosynthesis protein A
LSALPQVALLLAGGASRRMRREKLLIDVGGLSMLERAHALLSARFACVVVAVDGRRETFISDWVRWPDARPGAGPLPAVRSALERWQEPIFVCAADAAEARKADMDQLFAEWSPDFAALAVAGERGPEPLFAIYGPAFLSWLAAADAADASLRELLAEHADRILRTTPALRPNLNQADELQRWRKARST